MLSALGAALGAAAGLTGAAVVIPAAVAGLGFTAGIRCIVVIPHFCINRTAMLNKPEE